MRDASKLKQSNFQKLLAQDKLISVNTYFVRLQLRYPKGIAPKISPAISSNLTNHTENPFSWDSTPPNFQKQSPGGIL